MDIDPVLSGSLGEAAASPSAVTRCRAYLLMDRSKVEAEAQGLDDNLRAYFVNAARAYSGTADFSAVAIDVLPPDLRIEYPYYAAVNAYNGGDGETPAFGTDARSRALELTIQGYAAGRDKQYATEARLLFAAAQAYEAADTLDVPRYLAVLETATATAFELGLPNDPGISSLRLLALPEETHDRVASIFRNVGRSRWLAGRTYEAMGLLRDARSLRIDGPALAAVRLDIARIAKDANEPHFAHDQLDAVRRMNVDWRTAPTSFLTSIVTYAYCLARTDPGEARCLLAEARSIAPPSNTVLAQDERLDALWAMGEGMVDNALGRLKPAKQLLTSAYDRFNRIDHHFRCARAALEMARIADRELWLKRARLHAYHYGPESPLIEAANCVEAATARLGAREREVALALLNGESRANIATRMALEPRTVKNTIGRLYAKTGTATETALIIRLQKSGEI